MRNKNKFIAIVAVFVMVITLLGGCGGGGSKSSLQKDNSVQGQDSSSDINNGTINNVTETKAGTGRFFENEITLPGGIEDINALKKLADGSISFTGGKKGVKKAGKDNSYSYYIFNSTDKGQTWKQTEIEGLDGKFITKAAIAPDGGVALFNYAEDGKIKTYISNAEGKTESFSFESMATAIPLALDGGLR